MAEAQFVVYEAGGQPVVIPLPVQSAHGEVAAAAPASTVSCSAWWRRPTTRWFLLLVVFVAAGIAATSSVCLSRGCVRRKSSLATSPSATTTTGLPGRPPLGESMTTTVPPLSTNTVSPANATSVTGPIPNATLTRTEQIVEFINNITLAGRVIALHADDNDDDSHINKTDESVEEIALCWLIDKDPLQLKPDTGVQRFRLQQRYALATLWAHWTHIGLTFGDDEQEECTWEGVTCQVINLGSSIGSNGGDNGGDRDGQSFSVEAVTHIRLNNTDWKGRLSADLGLLLSLVHFDLKDNALTGSLPSSVGGQWSNLEYLAVGNNGLRGSLPESIGQWTKLKYFSVSANELTGSLPESIGAWTALEHFDVKWNFLNSSLPVSMGQWTNLDYCALSLNAFVGSLPDSIGKWSNLTYFTCSDNSLTGSIPSSVGQWGRLNFFNVAANSMTGSRLPNTIGSWSHLEYLSVYSNGLIGTVPKSAGNWKQLRYAYLYGNDLVGDLPEGMCSALNLTVLVVDCDQVNCTCSDICTCAKQA